jgi:hypothetical protein
MWIRGDKLSFSQRRQVLAAYIYRLTTENGYPQRNPCGAKVAAISDTQWLAEHAFAFTKDGRLDARYNHCEPACLQTKK